MDALTGADIDKLPFFDTTLYEKEALKLKEGQFEDCLDDDTRTAASGRGLRHRDQRPPNIPDLSRDIARVWVHVDEGVSTAAAITPLRCPSLSGTTQASYSTDVSTSDFSPTPNHCDRRSFRFLPQRHSMAASSLAAHLRRFTSSISSARASSLVFMNHTPSTGRRSISADGQPMRHSSTTSRLSYKHNWMKELSVTESGANSAQLPYPSRTPSPHSVLSQPSGVLDAMDASQCTALELAFKNPEFRIMWQEYSKLWERIIIFEIKQRRLLRFWAASSCTSLAEQSNHHHALLNAKHLREAEALDAGQLKEGLFLVEAHREERNRSAVALKHMKAYCSGSFVPGSTKRRIVTEVDKRHLREQERYMEELDGKHKAAMKKTQARHEKQEEVLKHEHERELAELNKRCHEAQILSDGIVQTATNQLHKVTVTRRRRVVQRWYIDLEVWHKSISHIDHIPALADLPVIPCLDPKHVGLMTSRTSSVLDTWHTFNDIPSAVSLPRPVASQPSRQSPCSPRHNSPT